MLRNSQSKEKKNENITTPKKHPFVIIDHPTKNIRSFNDMHISKYTSSITITGKQIQNFVGFPELEQLTFLNLDSNPIKSFEGAPQLPNLRYLSIQNSPISRNKFFKLMCLVVFGPNIKTINNSKVPADIKEKSLVVGEELLPELQKGRVISKLMPLRLIDTVESSAVSPSNSLMEASMKIGYASPSDKEYAKAWIQSDSISYPIPSVAVICEEINARENDECYIPSDIISSFSNQLSELRSQFNAEYVSSDSEEEEEEENEYENDSKTEISISSQNSSQLSSKNSQKVAKNDRKIKVFAKYITKSDSDSDEKGSQSSHEKMVVGEVLEGAEEETENSNTENEGENNSINEEEEEAESNNENEDDEENNSNDDEEGSASNGDEENSKEEEEEEDRIIGLDIDEDEFGNLIDDEEEEDEV